MVTKMKRIQFVFLVSSLYVVFICFGLLGLGYAEPSEKPFKCPEQFGYYADTEDCSKYFVCVFGDALHESCTGGLYFSAELQTCDWPRNVECADGAETPAKKEQSSSSQDGSFPSNRKTAGRNQETKSRTRPSGVPLGRVTSNSAVQTRAGSRYKPGSADDFLVSREETTRGGSRQNQLRSSTSTTTKTTTTTTTAVPIPTSTDIPTPVVATTELQIYRQTNVDITSETETTVSPIPTKSSLDDNSDSDQELLNNRFPGYDPQQPQFDEAVPPVVDSDGNIHIPDGSGGPFSNNPRTSELTKLSVFVKPIYGNSKVTSLPRPNHSDRPKEIYRNPEKVHNEEEEEDSRTRSKTQISSDAVHRVAGIFSNKGQSKEPEDSGIFYRSGDRNNRGRSTATLQLYRNVERYRQPTQDEHRRRPEFPSLPEKSTNNGEDHDPDAESHRSREGEAHRTPNSDSYPETDAVSIQYNGNRQHQIQHTNNGHYKDDDAIPEQHSNNGHHKDEDAIPEKHRNNGHHKDPDAVHKEHDEDEDDLPAPLTNNGNHKDPDVIIIHHTNNGNHKDPDAIPVQHSNNGKHNDPDVAIPVQYSNLDRARNPDVTEFSSLRTDSQARSRTRSRQPVRAKESTRKPETYNIQLYVSNPRTLNLAPVHHQQSFRHDQDPKFTSQHEFAKVTPKTTTTPPPPLPAPPKFEFNSRKTYSDYASLPYGYSDYYKDDDTDSKQPVFVARQRTTSRTTRPRQTSTTRRTTTTTTTTPATTKRLNRRPLPTTVNRPATRAPSLEDRGPPKPAFRPKNLYPTPLPNANAGKCETRKCRLPDCRCGGTDIPGGLKTHEVPQIVLLTFDDAVNDLNFAIYEEIFSPRKNPNGCPILGTFYVSHEWTDYGQVQTLYSRGHEMASHSITHSFGEKFSKQQWMKEVNGQREILHLYGGVKLEDVRGMRAPFLQIGGNSMFEMLHEANFTYDSSMPVFENNPPYWPYTLDYAMSHECMIAPCPTKSFPGVWEIGMVMWIDLRGGRCSMGDACSNPSDEEGVHKVLMKNFNRHYKSNRAPFNLYYHSAWFTTQHHRRGFMKFLDEILSKGDVWLITNWQMIQWIRNPTPNSQIHGFEPWQCKPQNDKPVACRNPQVCNVWYQGGVRFMKTCQPCPSKYPWVGNTGFEKRG